MLVAVAAFYVSSGAASECGWYFNVYFMDATLGITLAILFHKASNGLARYMQQQRQLKPTPSGGDYDYEHPWWEALVEIGNYGDPPNYRKWGIQVSDVFWCKILN